MELYIVYQGGGGVKDMSGSFMLINIINIDLSFISLLFN